MLSRNAVDSVNRRSSKLVRLTLEAADLSLIVTELVCSAARLELLVELADGTVSEIWSSESRVQIGRLRDIARAIVLASP